MLSNIIWGRLSSKSLNKFIAQITIATTIFAIFLAFINTHLYGYMTIFFLVGTAMDGNRIASGNLLLILAPEEKRPVYSALQTNIVSFGMFFSIVGGVILNFTNYTILYSFTILNLGIAFALSFKLKDERIE